MAAPARVTLTRIAAARTIGRLIGGLALAVGCYGLAGWIGSAIPRNGDWREPAHGVEVMVETNGVHTAVVMPLVTPIKDWREDFPTAAIAAPDAAYTHISVSWGEREIYLNTPSWADLSPLAVLRILTAGGQGLLHVAYYGHPAPDEEHRVLRISETDYARLVGQIEARLPPRTGRQKHPGYDGHDVFYDAPGRYTAFNTCNQWTSDVLAGAGIRTGWWTPFAGGVMKWVPHAP